MPSPTESQTLVRFADFEVDLQSSELRRRGVRVKLPEQAFRVLSMLVERPGGLVTREELRQRLWKDDTFVDFDTGLNSTVKRLRDALGDSADNPRFVETLPRRGYRFIAAVEWDGGAVGKHAAVPEVTLPAAPEAGVRRFRIVQLALAGAALTTVVAVIVALNLEGWRDRLLNRGNSPRIESIAVLPLENLSRDPEQEYFADGMTEALIMELGKIRALRVISRQSVMQYKDSQKPLTQIAQELKVDAVVEGAVMREGNRVSVTAQLIQARPERHLWAERYERDLTSILVLQSEVARDIAREIRITVTPTEATRLAHTRPVNPEAHEAYLKGRHFWEMRTRESLQKALRYFESAIQMDPNYALGYAGVADTYSMLGGNYFLAPQESYPKARAAAQKALELDENLVEAHATMAAVLSKYDWDWPRAGREFNRALQLNRGYANAHHWYAFYLSGMGRHTEAIAEMRTARSLDPLSPRINANVGLMLYFAHQYNQAIQELQKALELFPDHDGAHLYLGISFSQVGQHDQAIAELQRCVTLVAGSTEPKLYLAWAYARAGKPQEAKRMIEEVLKARRLQYASPYVVAQVYTALAQKDQAFAWLEKGYAERDAGMLNFSVDPGFDPLRDDPRFKALLRRMNFPE